MIVRIVTEHQAVNFDNENIDIIVFNDNSTTKIFTKSGREICVTGSQEELAKGLSNLNEMTTVKVDEVTVK